MGMSQNLEPALVQHMELRVRTRPRIRTGRESCAGRYPGCHDVTDQWLFGKFFIEVGLQLAYISKHVPTTVVPLTGGSTQVELD